MGHALKSDVNKTMPEPYPGVFNFQKCHDDRMNVVVMHDGQPGRHSYLYTLIIIICFLQLTHWHIV